MTAALPLITALTLAQFGPWLGVGMRGPMGRPATASGILNLTLCADGSTSYPCAATETTVKPAGGTVTVSSGASTCNATATSSLTNVLANDLCIASSAGANIYGAAEHSNLLAYSSPASWTLSNVTADDVSTSCPLWVDGTTRMDLLTSTGADPSAAIDAANSRCRCVWLALPTGDSAHDVTFSDYSGDGPQAVTLTAAPTRVCATATGHTGIKLAWVNGNNVCAMRGTGQNTTVCGVTNPAPQAAGAPVSGSADTASVAMTLTNQAQWCVGVKATPNTDWGTTGTTVWGLLLGGAYQAANSFYLARYSDDLYFVVYDAGGAASFKRAIYDAGDGTTAKTIIACNNAGTPSLYIDGVLTSVSTPIDGTGTGLLVSMPATLGIGVRNTAEQWNGSVSKVCQSKDFAGCRKALQ